jgi:non-specific serine/threonine protein kinase/serine/threonine-protein kinase
MPGPERAMSDDDRWHEVDKLFDAALDLPPEERAAFLESRCPPDLRQQVETLIKGSAQIDGYLPPGAGLEGSLARGVLDDLERGGAAPGAAQAGALIDGYRLTSRLGEGGMGEVWEAEQVTPVRRRVAVKLIKPGMDSRHVVARFESERQALALMNHRNVAQVFGGGATPSGRPYFVMEFVPGVSVTEYCRRHSLPLEPRLSLFLEICEGVQHAHYKGIVHRDLKPSNILVTEEQGRPVPKIIDFGVARALDTHLTADTVLTEQGQIIGTPEYMSPEQADPLTGDVDTRADVYALGVLLYELLAGVRPFDAADLKALGFLELLRRIRETDPPRPSQRAEPTQSRRLRGDLDWIVMKAIEKDRTRRYVSPHEMAEDVRRHLMNQPVLAGPPSKAYRLKKLVRRHRATVAAATLAVIALVAGSVVATTQAVRARRAERAARADAETARQVSEFLVELFEVSDPGVARGTTVTARELLDRGAARMKDELAGQPLVQARLQTLVGEINRKLGSFDAARPLLEQALATRESVLGVSDPESVRTLHALARLHGDQGDFAKAEALFREAMERVDSAPRPDAAEGARLRCQLANLLREKARYAEAEELLRQGLAVLTRELGPGNRDVGAAWGDLGSTLGLAGKVAEAETAFRTAISINEATLGPDHPELASTLNNLSGLLVRSGRMDEGRTTLLRAIAIAEKAYGKDHPSVASMVAGLGALHGREGRLDAALAAFTRALAIRERVFGPEHALTAQVLKNMGLVYVLQGDYLEGRRTLERTLAIEQKTVGPEHPQAAWTELRLGALHARLNELDAAEASYRRGVASFEKARGAGTNDLVSGVRGLAEVALRRGRLAEAETLMARALTLVENGNPKNPELPPTLTAAARLRLRQRRYADAQAALDRARPLQPPGHPGLVATLVLAGDVQAAQGEFTAAESSYREALAIAEKAHGPTHPDTAEALHGLGVALDRQGRAAEAADCLERALAIRNKLLGPRHPDTRATARAQDALGKG